jgi:hypothetical protein
VRCMHDQGSVAVRCLCFRSHANAGGSQRVCARVCEFFMGGVKLFRVNGRGVPSCQRSKSVTPKGHHKTQTTAERHRAPTA